MTQQRCRRFWSALADSEIEVMRILEPQLVLERQGVPVKVHNHRALTTICAESQQVRTDVCTDVLELE